jgi:hypothetical protein
MGEADAFDRDDVEAQLEPFTRMFVLGPAQPALGESPHLCLLGRRDGSRRPTVAVGSASLHLAHDDERALTGDDIQIATQLGLGRAPAGGDDVEAERPEVPRRLRFSPGAARPVGEISVRAGAAQNSRFSRTLAALPMRSRR